jgi:hypothetical protein
MHIDMSFKVEIQAIIFYHHKKVCVQHVLLFMIKNFVKIKISFSFYQQIHKSFLQRFSIIE